MGSSTLDTSTRFVLGERERAQRHGRGGDDGRRWRSPAASSPTGVERRWWTARLERALRADEFVLHYQPIAAIDGGEISHHEALLRLAGGVPGRLLAPGRFLPAAERYGFLEQIERMVLSKVIALLGAPAGLGAGWEVRIAVNLSAQAVTAPGMLAHIEEQLDRHGVRAERLVIEITETSAITDMSMAGEFCAGLERLGCEVALDDFGVGFGTFRYVKHLTFRYLKIDGDFVRGLACSPRDERVVRALVGVARAMGKETIAEYVADGATVDVLRGLGVDYAQGFGIGRPRAAAQAFAQAA